MIKYLAETVAACEASMGWPEAFSWIAFCAAGAVSIYAFCRFVIGGR